MTQVIITFQKGSQFYFNYYLFYFILLSFKYEYKNVRKCHASSKKATAVQFCMFFEKPINLVPIMLLLPKDLSQCLSYQV